MRRIATTQSAAFLIRLLTRTLAPEYDPRSEKAPGANRSSLPTHGESVTPRAAAESLAPASPAAAVVDTRFLWLRRLSSVSADSSRLEPPLSRRNLPDEVNALREIAAADFAKRERELQPHIDAHIAVYASEVEKLKNAHANIASGTDLVIGAKTRWSAIWELAGRCIAEIELLLHALRGGFAMGASANVRAMFEAMYLLGAVAFDDATAERWLSGKEVRPKKARAVMVKKQALAHTRAKAAGIEPVGDIAETGGWIYQHFSQYAHHLRGSIIESTSLERREFAYGPHPDPAKRGRETEEIGHLIETALIVIADTLADLVGREDLPLVLAEREANFERVRREEPVSG
jgi:hypothetical protein